MAAVKMPTPAVSTQATASHPSIDKPRQLIRAEPRPTLQATSKLLQPVKKAVVSKHVTSTASCLPSLPTIPVPSTRSAPISSTRAVASSKTGKELELPIPVAAKRCIVKTSIVSTSPAGNKRTHGTIGGIQYPVIAEERAPKRSADAQQLAPPQTQSSKIPGGMREEQRTAYVMRKIHEEKATHCLPKSTMVLTSPIPPILLTPPAPCHIFDESEPSLKTTAGQWAEDVVSETETSDDKNSQEESVALTLHAPLSAHQTQTISSHRGLNELESPTKREQTQCTDDIVVNKEKETSTNKRLPGSLVVETLPVNSSAHQAQKLPALPTEVTHLHQPPDELPIHIEIAPGRHGILVVSSNHLTSDRDLPKAEAAQRRSEPIKAPTRGVEGLHLARAVAYIKEHLAKRSLASKTFIP
ncbi:hypothetical protein AX14_004525 [Amanita brunnescens Koide BX004]|nr:hypothetical protein AX14_004525 [Amanita brunnescens Koide BX004]